MRAQDELIMQLIFTVLFSVIIFLACRFIILWYYKINERVELLKEIVNELKKLNSK